MLIQPYQKRWANDFKEIKKVILEALAHISISIEHVGSTSVPNLAAKPIIDIDLVYGPDVVFDNVKAGLETIGYYHHGDQGIPEREVFKRKDSAIKHNVLDSIHHHLYVCPAHSQELKRHLLFRNFLIANETERLQYQAIKLQIAKEANQDITKYAEIKEIWARDFILSIVERAKAKNKKL